MSAPSPGPAPGKREQVAAMFNRIAPRYDLLNRLLSAGIDQRWRHRAISRLGDELQESFGTREGHQILDVATGTADLAIAASKLEPARVTGVDPAESMLALGQRKVARAGLDPVIELRAAASEALPFDDDSFDGATVAFGVRNFEDRRRGLDEIARVLRPGAPLIVLEFSRPRGPLAPLFGFYFQRVLPRIGALISGDSGAYDYLHDSVQVFPEGEAFLAELRAAGFARLDQERLTLGIASIYVGVLPRAS